jgi:PTH1 family peptidyl-tRNA hydrolase
VESDVEPWVVVGLGNPGPEYAGTRHNVGFAALDRLASALAAAPFDTTRSYVARKGRLPGGDGRELVLLAPQTYMNLSGDALVEFDARHGLSPGRLLVVVDDVYLPLGQLRLRTGGSDGGHNGLASIEAAVGTTAYARLRIGVGRGGEETQLRDHVLSGFGADEESAVNEAIQNACEAALTWAREGAIPAMNRFNKAPEGER